MEGPYGPENGYSRGKCLVDAAMVDGLIEKVTCKEVRQAIKKM